MRIVPYSLSGKNLDGVGGWALVITLASLYIALRNLTSTSTRHPSGGKGEFITCSSTNTSEQKRILTAAFYFGCSKVLTVFLSGLKLSDSLVSVAGRITDEFYPRTLSSWAFWLLVFLEDRMTMQIFTTGLGSCWWAPFPVPAVPGSNFYLSRIMRQVIECILKNCLEELLY